MKCTKCELCQSKIASDMRFGVWLCVDCIDGYEKSMHGDVEKSTLFSNPDNFPHATDLATKNIINVISNRLKRMESQNNNPEYLKQQEIKEKEEKRESYAKSVGVEYGKSDDFESTIDGWYTDIGKKIKSWAKWIFILEAIGFVISGLFMLFSTIWFIGLLTIILGPIAAWGSSWLLYAFGELVDKTVANERNTQSILKLMLDNNTNKDS